MKLTSDKSRKITPEDGVPAGVEVVEVVEEEDKDKEEQANKLLDEMDVEKFYRNLDTKGDSLGQGRGLVNWSPWEVVGTLSYIYSMNSIETGSTLQENNFGTFDLILGVERYNPKSRNLWRDFSFIATFEWSTTSMDNESFWEGSYPKDLIGFGLGTNWHFGNDPFAFNSFIGFVSLGLGGGVRQFTMVSGSNAFLEETGFFSWNFGLGTKWYTKSGLGLRAILEYFSRSGNSSITVNGNTPVYKTAGPRFRIGASWRF
jgi:hypothetical protein